MISKHHLELSTIAEIGCGAGEILRQLQTSLPRDIALNGYEISPQAFALCQQRSDSNLNFFFEDLLTIDVKPFDALLCIDVIEHVDDYMGFLRTVRGKGTYKLLHIPLDMSAQWVLRGRPLVRIRNEVGHLHYFCKETALATLRDTGYTVIDWFYTAGALHNPRTVKARLMAIPRRTVSRVSEDLAARTLGGYSLLVLAT